MPTASTEPRACLLTNTFYLHRCSFQGLVCLTFQTPNMNKCPTAKPITSRCPAQAQCPVFPVISKSAGMLEVPILSDCYLTPLMHPFTLPLCRSFPSPAGLFCPTAVSLYHLVFEKVWEKMGRCQLLLIFGDCYPATRTFESQNLFTYVTN